MSSSTNHRVLITGASSGIGRATALAFAKSGVDLALLSRSEEKLEAVAAEAQACGVEVRQYPFDLSHLDQVKAKIAAIASDFGPLDVLVNNAGIGYTGDVATTPLADWQQVMNINLTSVFQCIQGILPSMRDRRKGLIINVASIAAYHSFPGWAAYNVSKAGLISLSKTLAAEERAHGIRVVIVSPGSVNTPIWDTDTVSANFDRTQMLTPEIVAQTILYAATLPEQAVIEELTVTASAGAL